MAADPVRVASVGLGWWGATLATATQKLSALSDALASVRADNSAGSAPMELVSCWSPSERKHDFATEYGCRAAASWEDLLADPEVEAVLLATPHSTHADLTVEAAAAGKHVFVEKPLTLNVADGKRAIAAANDAGVVLQVGQNRRRQPSIRRLKELVSSGDLGRLHHVEGAFTHAKALNPRTGWRGDPAECPAGGMTGLGVHIVDNLIYLAGRPARLAAFSKRIAALSRLDEATTITMEFESGPLGFVATTTVVPDQVSNAAYGTSGAAWSEVDGARFYRQEVGDKERREEPVGTLDTVRDQLAEFAACVRTGVAPEVGGPEALEVVAVLEATVESARDGRVIELDEIRGVGPS